MLNKDEIDVYCHFMYENSTEIIDRLKDVWNGRVIVSLVEGGEFNKKIKNKLTNCFENLIIKEYKNRGSDQYGFWRNFYNTEDKKNWCFQIHDKKYRDWKWVEDLVYRIFDNEDRVNSIINEENSDVGIILGDHTYYKALITEEELVEQTKSQIFGDNIYYDILCKQTLCWLRQLQWSMLQDNQIYNSINFNFGAGNMFLCRKEIIEICHDYVLDNFFEYHYRQDGDIAHALERFYFYTNNNILNKKTLTLTNMVKNG